MPILVKTCRNCSCENHNRSKVCCECGNRLAHVTVDLMVVYTLLGMKLVKALVDLVVLRKLPGMMSVKAVVNIMIEEMGLN